MLTTNLFNCFDKLSAGPRKLIFEVKDLADPNEAHTFVRELLNPMQERDVSL